MLLCILLGFDTRGGYLFSLGSSNVVKKNNTVEKNFQHVVHGSGLGATTKPTWCYINFDPRIDPLCPCIEWPIPGDIATVQTTPERYPI